MENKTQVLLKKHDTEKVPAYAWRVGFSPPQAEDCLLCS